MILSPLQDKALRAVDYWFKHESKAKKIYRLFGVAGTGKSTLAKHFSESIEGAVMFASYTGKAAHVMVKKGCPGATTIHRLIYRPSISGKGQLRRLEQELEKEKFFPEPNWDTINLIQDAITKEKEHAGKMHFSLNTESDLRFAKLLIVDECFPGTTLIDTPSGKKTLSSMVSGDMILNAYGADTVVAILKKEINNGCAQINIGRTTITTSKTHRFFTQRGLVSAQDLRCGDTLCETTEAMRLLRNCDKFGEKTLSYSLLQFELFEALVDKSTRISGKDLHQRTRQEMWRGSQKIFKFWNSGSSKANKNVRRHKTCNETRSGSANKQNSQGAWEHIQDAWRKWKRANTRTISALQYLGEWVGNRIYIFYQKEAQRWLSSPLQIRHWKWCKENMCRGGWENTYLETKARSRFEENKTSRRTRVESITFLESGDSRLDKFRDEQGKLYFYDIQAKRHSSFSIEGILVHNCSMVDKTVGEDLLSFGVPILVLGDPEQLPPIFGGGYFTAHKADIFLEEIHRQALDNPIIAMSKLVREGKPLPLGDYGSSKVVDTKLEDSEIMNHDIILTGLRKTKLFCDNKARSIKGITYTLPVEGDRLMCVKNNHELGLLNGQLWECISTAIPIAGGEISLHLRDSESGNEIAVTANEKLLRGQSLERWEHEEGIEEFEYAYAMTVHKSQGSQWDSVLLFDQKERFPMYTAIDRRRWLYTGITRAAERITVMRL